MSFSSGGERPLFGINNGHLHYQHELKTLWMYIGGPAHIPSSWVSIFSQTELDTDGWTERQRGSIWIDSDGNVKRWSGSSIVSTPEIRIKSIRRKLSTRKFQLYDGTAYTQKPNLRGLYGIIPIRLLYEDMLFQGQPNHTILPLESTVTTQAVSAALLADDVPIITDIESYLYYTNDVTGATQRSQMIQVFDWMYAVKPTMFLGMYAFAPRRDYFRAIRQVAGYDTWQVENQLMSSVVDKVKVLFPSLYTLSCDREKWIIYAVENIKEARRYAGDKPVYPFLWPRFHDSLPSIGGTLLPPDFWMLQLNVLREIADGVVIWTSNVDAVSWSESMPWWIATKEFMKTL